jgi:hypothetical protein
MIEDDALAEALTEYATKKPDDMDNGVPFVHDVPQELLRDVLARLRYERQEPVAWAWYTPEDERLRFSEGGRKPEPHENPTNKILVPLIPAPELQGEK